VRGETFELGEPLSAAAASNLESALALLEKLCVGPSHQAWDQLALPDQESRQSFSARAAK
jgi:hypothetical protein